MDLRPELLFPPVPHERVERLGAEIDRIARLIEDGRVPEARLSLAAFNERTGHGYELSDFAAYWESESLQDIARNAARPYPPRVPDITREELAEIVRRIMEADQETDYYLKLLDVNVPHPRVSDLIFWPPEELRDATPEQIVDIALSYRPISPSESPDRLRAGMVARLKEQGWIRSPEVAAAFAKAPRERFAPEAPSLAAAYSAALIAELVGPEGLVVTVDIDPFVTERATRFLADTGYPQVKVVLGDAEHVGDEDGPYDAILVTAGAWDCPWGRLLAPGGRLVVPLRFCGITRSITFVRYGDRLAGLDPEVCGFVPMQGTGAHEEQVAALAGGAVTLTLDGGPALDTAALDRALTGDPAELWTGVVVRPDEPFDTAALWLATHEDTFGVIWQSPDHDLVRPVLRWFCPALITPDSFAYLTYREDETGERRIEFGVHGHGPLGPELARRLAAHLRTWDRDWRHHPGPRFTLHPADAMPPAPATGRIFPKRHTHLVIDWA
ncbi:bacteriocin immunity protein [Nonomuraea phyllanthi]|nr:bacteriocin immunity protein [Nonomuraea phyllanthi]